jgi:hypothetical protein
MLLFALAALRHDTRRKLGLIVPDQFGRRQSRRIKQQDASAGVGPIRRDRPMKIAQRPRLLAISSLMAVTLVVAQIVPQPDGDPRLQPAPSATSDPQGALPWLRPEGHF